MKKNYVIGMILAVVVISLGVLIIPKGDKSKKVNNGGDVVAKIETAAKAVDAYYGEISVTGAVGSKTGANLIKQWYKKGKIYSENYIYTGSEKKQKMQKTSISLKNQNQTTIYNIVDNNAIITKSFVKEDGISQDSNFLQFPLDIIKNQESREIKLENNQYIFKIVKGDYQYTVKYDKDNLMPKKLDINHAGKFLSAMEFKRLDINNEIKDSKFSVKIPAKTKIIKRNYNIENTNLDKLRLEVKYPILLPSYLPSGASIDKVSKEEFDETQIVNIVYKGETNIYITEAAASKVNKSASSGLKKVSIGKYQGYQSDNGKNICLTWNQDKTAVTIYSELDVKTLMKIAESFEEVK